MDWSGGVPRTTFQRRHAFVSAHLVGYLLGGPRDYGNHRGFIAPELAKEPLLIPPCICFSQISFSLFIGCLRLRIPCHSLARDSRHLSREAAARGLVSSDPFYGLLGLQVASQLARFVNSRLPPVMRPDRTGFAVFTLVVFLVLDRGSHDLVVLVRRRICHAVFATR